jgi:SAM-dependent methyltransferase
MDNSNQYSHIETKVHPMDEMYLFFTSHPDHKDTPLQSYFDSGAGMIRTLLEILDKIGLRLEETNSFLEFACGYGRFTRHLVKIVPPLKITGADVYKEAVDFQKTVFGVKGFYSEFDPEDVTIPEKYDIIFVASLFSHLPLNTWRPWLKKLYHSLNENGVLIFSTHGSSCMADPGKMPDEGFLYCHMSESKILSFKDYATTYVTSEFVHKAVNEETGQFVLLDIPKCLWNYQDVYIVQKFKMGEHIKGSNAD